VKLVALVADPAAVEIVIGPVFAPSGTVTEMEVSALAVIVPAAPPVKVTPVEFAREVPMIVTVLPTIPLVGMIDVILGLTRNTEGLVAVPPGVVTVIVPAVTPEGAVVVIVLSDTTLNGVAARPLNFTAVAPVNAPPVIVIAVPATPEWGVKSAMEGIADTVIGMVTALMPSVAVMVAVLETVIGAVVAVKSARL